MPTVKDSRKVSYMGQTLQTFSLVKTWGHSPKGPSGSLKLRANAYTMQKIVRTGYKRTSTAAPSLPVSSGVTPPANWTNHPRVRDAVEAQAYARFRGKAYDGSGALGVTFASLGQSRDMIRARSKTLLTESTELLAQVATSRRKGKDASGLMLETVFGWVPLYEDIHAASSTIIQKADGLEFLRGSGKSSFGGKSISKTSSQYHIEMLNGTSRCTIAALVEVKNPNRWLLERAGLLNYGAIAWDLVPWSFLVNAFSSTGAIVNSLTDFAGLAFKGATITRVDEFNHEISSGMYTIYNKTWNESQTGFGVKNHNRQMWSGLYTPPLTLRVPELNLMSAGIALSLVVQNLTKLTSLYKLGQASIRSFRNS